MPALYRASAGHVFATYFMRWEGVKGCKKAHCCPSMRSRRRIGVMAGFVQEFIKFLRTMQFVYGRVCVRIWDENLLNMSHAPGL